MHGIHLLTGLDSVPDSISQHFGWGIQWSLLLQRLINTFVRQDGLAGGQEYLITTVPGIDRISRRMRAAQMSSETKAQHITVAQSF